MKTLLIMMSLFYMAGCSTTKPPLIQEINRIGEEVSGVYTKENSTDTTLSSDGSALDTNKKFFYAGSGKTKENKFFFIQNNACITEDYMIGIVSHISEEYYSLEIGSHCYNRESQGGFSNINHGLIPIKDDKSVEIFDYVRVYYKFPEEFIPESYLDYLNYSTEIEITGEKYDPTKD